MKDTNKKCPQCGRDVSDGEWMSVAGEDLCEECAGDALDEALFGETDPSDGDFCFG